MNNRKVAYFYNQQMGRFHYGKEHPMKPKRICMAHNLIVNFGLYKYLDVYVSRQASKEEMSKFHDPDYIEYLSKFIQKDKNEIVEEFTLQNNKKNFNPTAYNLDCEDHSLENNISQQLDERNEKKNIFRVGDTSDCPEFNGLFTFCQLSAGASIDCARLILNNDCNIAINWSGGLHHAKKKEASGFCYVNDAVICILELLEYFPRVLYIDIDVHHGDGVEEAFFTTNRVMTVSFHQYGEDFYPGSGNIDSTGEGTGKNYAVNVPLKPGMNDESYVQLFKNIITRVMQVYRPYAVVLQCGADSLSLDKLGQFNLSTRGHGACIEFMSQQSVPLIVVGGGGYTIQNVARCWAYETGVCLNQKIEGSIPQHDIYHSYYEPDFKLHYQIKSNIENKNKPEEIHRIEETIFEHLRRIECAPGIQFHDVPTVLTYDYQEELNADERGEMNLREYEKDNDMRLEDPEGREIMIERGSQRIHKHEI